jgi:hypothetical protein
LTARTSNPERIHSTRIDFSNSSHDLEPMCRP